MKYAFIIALVGMAIGYVLYSYFPAWVCILFVLVNLLGLVILRGGSSEADRKEEEE